MNSVLPPDLTAQELLTLFKKDEELYTILKGYGLNEAGLQLNIRARPSEDHFAEKNYWQALVYELHLLLCTDDEKYAELRQKLNSMGKKVEEATAENIVKLIASALPGAVVVGPQVLWIFVAMLLYLIARVGVNAWCAVSQDRLIQTLEEGISSDD